MLFIVQSHYKAETKGEKITVKRISNYSTMNYIEVGIYTVERIMP